MLKQSAFFVVLTVFGLVASESITFSSCKDTHKVLPTKVELTPCPSQPCVFYHGQTVDVKITFNARQDESKLTAAIHGIINLFVSLSINWPMPNSDGCKDQGIACPIVKGKEYTYHSSFFVKDIYPKIRLPVMWELNGDVNEFCFRFPMSIADGKPYDPDVIG